MSWSEIKYALNSALGKGKFFTPLDELVRGGGILSIQKMEFLLFQME